MYTWGCDICMYSLEPLSCVPEVTILELLPLTHKQIQEKMTLCETEECVEQFEAWASGFSIRA